MNNCPFLINGREICDENPPYIIAEVSANHNGSIQRAIDTIKAAKESGVDAVKIQTYTPDTMTLKCNKPDFYISKGLWSGKQLYDLYEEAYTPYEWHIELFQHAKEVGITIFSTPFDEVSADFLENLGVAFFKIGSGELTHYNLLRHVAKKGKPIIISTGMADLNTIKYAIEVVREAGNDQIIVTHCVSVYPAPPELANIRAIPRLKEELDTLVGWSDHTMTDSAAAAAVALGACYVERHITLSRAIPEGDNAMSTEPGEFTQLVHVIRETEKVLGTDNRTILAEESIGVESFRRGLYVRSNIIKGQCIDASMIAVRRPNVGIGADSVDSVINRHVNVDLVPEQPIQWEHLES